MDAHIFTENTDKKHSIEFSNPLLHSLEWIETESSFEFSPDFSCTKKLTLPKLDSTVPLHYNPKNYLKFYKIGIGIENEKELCKYSEKLESINTEEDEEDIGTFDPSKIKVDPVEFDENIEYSYEIEPCSSISIESSNSHIKMNRFSLAKEIFDSTKDIHEVDPIDTLDTEPLPTYKSPVLMLPNPLPFEDGEQSTKQCCNIQ